MTGGLRSRQVRRAAIFTGGSFGVDGRCCEPARWRRCSRWSGPGVLAGLSDDDPAGITTYSILGAKYGYELLWVLAALDRGADRLPRARRAMGVVTGKGLSRWCASTTARAARASRSRRWWSPTSARCAPSSPASPPAGPARRREPLRQRPARGDRRLPARPARVLSPRRARPAGAERASSSPTSSPGFLAHPDWGATAQGLVVPSMPLTRDAVLVAVATVGTTLAPWGLAFIQSYAVDKRLTVEDLRYERIDVIVGAVLTGVIGLFIVVACAATLHAQRITINDAGDAAGRWSRWRAPGRDALRPRASSAPRCWPRRSSRSRPPTRSPRPSASRPIRRQLRARRASST